MRALPLLTLLLPAAAGAVELPEFRLSLRGQLAGVEDESWAAIGESRLMGGADLGAAAFLGERLMVGLAYASRHVSGRTYNGFASSLEGNALRADVGWRWLPLSRVQLYARAGLGAWWWELVYDPDVGGRIASEDFRPGFFAGLGADLWLFGGRESLDDDTEDHTLSLGFNLELTYDRFLPPEFAEDGRSLGSIDPSGPGVLMGFTLQY